MRVAAPIRAVLALTAIALSGCNSPAPTPTPSPTPSPRGPSPVVLKLVEPVNGQVVHGSTVHVVVQVEGGTIVTQTTPYSDPTKGHVHLYLQNKLIYMSYTLSEDVPVAPGLTYSMHAEWVGSDHLPFTPRDVTPSIFFSVASS